MADGVTQWANIAAISAKWSLISLLCVMHCRWLQLLLQVAELRSQLAGRPACSHLQDSCCALLAALSQAPATSAVLTSSTHIRQGVLQLLHGVLRRYVGTGGLGFGWVDS
jgi:hypothetical protein